MSTGPAHVNLGARMLARRGSREYEEILNFINEQITPHLRQALRAVGTLRCRRCRCFNCWASCTDEVVGQFCVGFAGESRPDDPVAFIAGCFVSGEVPEAAAARNDSEQSLSAYLGEHQVVAIVQQAVGACAAAQPAPENPLQFVGEYIQDRHVGGAVRQHLLPPCLVACAFNSRRLNRRSAMFNVDLCAGRAGVPSHGRR
eukprot:COSAG06_NODE_3662_length_5052_cov_16.029667_4_plen_201_part_00